MKRYSYFLQSSYFLAICKLRKIWKELILRILTLDSHNRTTDVLQRQKHIFLVLEKIPFNFHCNISLKRLMIFPLCVWVSKKEMHCYLDTDFKYNPPLFETALQILYIFCLGTKKQKSNNSSSQEALKSHKLNQNFQNLTIFYKKVFFVAMVTKRRWGRAFRNKWNLLILKEIREIFNVKSS